MMKTFFSLLLTLPCIAQEPLRVVGISPPAHSISADAFAPVMITFDEPLDTAAVSRNNVRVFGRWSGPAAGTIRFDNDNRILRFESHRPFFAGEWVTVQIAKTIRSASGRPLTRGYAFNFWIRTQPGNMKFTKTSEISLRQPGEGQIQAYGAYAGDLNRDGWSDLSIPNEITSDIRVMFNDGTGNYSGLQVHPLPPGRTPSPNEGSDLNNDGWIDLIVGGQEFLHVLMGSSLTFEPMVEYTIAPTVRGVAVFDLDADGDDDVVTANRQSSNIAILTNDGTGHLSAPIFINGSEVQETACAAADANGDGILDLFVGSLSSRELSLYLGNAEGQLTFSSKIAAGGNCWMVAAGDLNADGIVDVASANSFSNNASIAFGNGTGGFLSVATYATGAFPLAIDLGDLDGDGDLDIVTSNFSGKNFTVLKNDGLGNFSFVDNLPARGSGSCAILHDRDNDGDLDISGIDEIDDILYLYTNTGSTAKTQKPFALSQNYPNPFNPRTRITYRITTPGHVRLTLYNLLGQKVRALVNTSQSAGPQSVEWNGLDDRDRPVSSGVYLYRLTLNNHTETRRMLLIK